MSYARAGSSPAFGTIFTTMPRCRGVLVRAYAARLSPAFGTIFTTMPRCRGVLVRACVARLSPAFGNVAGKSLLRGIGQRYQRQHDRHLNQDAYHCRQCGA